MNEENSIYTPFLKDFHGIIFIGRMDFIPIVFYGAVQEITGYNSNDFLSGNPKWDEIIFYDDKEEFIIASEDIGLANPNALLLANSCFDAVLVGSAQVREGTALLQHGSILLESGTQEVVKRVTRGDASPVRATSLAAALGRAATFEEVADALAATAMDEWTGAWREAD